MKFLFYGATGRMGSLLHHWLPRDSKIIYGDRIGIYLDPAKKDYQGFEKILKTKSPIIFVDLSLDYSSVDAMINHELIKTMNIGALKKSGQLFAYVGASSGASQFPDSAILSQFYMHYANLKRQRKLFLKSLEIPFFYPDIFTLIGQSSYGQKTVGWVDVMDTCISSDEVCIGYPLELRSWVSESKLLHEMTQFISHPIHQIEGGITEGVFCLQDIVEIVQQCLNKKVSVKSKSCSRWLSVAYLNQSREVVSQRKKMTLESYILPLINKE